MDKGGDVGGTWYFNRYPGAACDIESYVYMPLLEELGYVPSEKYAKGEEIFNHCRAIAKQFDLYDDICLQTTVEDVVWNEELCRWIVTTDRGDEMKARYVSLAKGYLQKPKLPGIPGIDAYKGKMFRTCRWDYNYTGGDARGNLTGLADKRVGIIGTGATAVQCVPHLGASAKELYVFQRTPSSIDVRANEPTDPEWAAKLKPGWHEERTNNFHVLTTGGFAETDLVDDGWTKITKTLIGMIMNEPDPDLSPEAIAEKVELADFVNMEAIRKRVDEIVKDPETAEALKPYYRQFCKRPCFHDDYLQPFNRPNVTLVDTKGQGVERITENALIVDGVEYEVDCLIFATGFEVGTDYGARAGFDPVGASGKSLTEYWKNGARTLHGIHIHDFPNLFMVGVTQSGFTVNFVHLIDHIARTIASTIQQSMEKGFTRIEATAEAEQEWVQKVFDKGQRTVEFAENCTPGYYNNEGKPDPAHRQNNFYYGDDPMEYYQMLKAWCESGELTGLKTD